MPTPNSPVARERMPEPLSASQIEEAVQGAGMVGPFHVQRAAESDASVRLRARSHVPGTRRDRAQAGEAGIRKAKPPIETPSVGIRLWAVCKRVRPMNRLRRTSQVHATLLGCATGGGCVRIVYAPEPPLCICSRVRHGSVREVSCRPSKEAWVTQDQFPLARTNSLCRRPT